MSGQVFSIIVFAVAAAEVAVGLALVISVYRQRRTVIADDLDMMKWYGERCHPTAEELQRGRSPLLNYLIARGRMANETLIWLIPIPPLLAFFVIVLVTNRSKPSAIPLHWAGAILVVARGDDHLCAGNWPAELAHEPLQSAVNWIPTADTWLRVGVLVDPLSAIDLVLRGLDRADDLCVQRGLSQLRSARRRT